MNLLLKKASLFEEINEIAITGSKSETNRLLMLQALFANISLKNTSNSDDSIAMENALKSTENTIDIHHAGTAMRFLTAYFAQKEGCEIVLTGSSRMQERPISVLVDALKQLGADIEYADKIGFPPLKINGRKLIKNKVSLAANVSSQYISALLLIAPKLENGLELTLEGEITSISYIKMTLALLNEIGVETNFDDNIILVKPKLNVEKIDYTIESDWSSASYFYSILALSKVGTEIKLSSYKKNSLQGDSVLAEIYTSFGVETTFTDTIIGIKKVAECSIESIHLDLNNAPDIAQTIAVTCFGLKMKCHLTGLHTLKIKETDRLEALKTELTKLGANISVSNESLTLEPSNILNDNINIATYQDHRMAMAFAPLALKTNIIIENADVVSKSYPGFWKDLQHIGFDLDENNAL